MPGTAGLYFRGLTQPQTNALRARLNDLAGDFGYVAHSGPTTGPNRGVLAGMLVGIDAGEVATTKLEAIDLRIAIAHLETIEKDWAVTITAALATALTRQLETALRAILTRRAADERE